MLWPAGQSLAMGRQQAADHRVSTQASTQLYHFTSSLVPAVGAQVMHIDGIMTLQTGSSGSLSGSTLHLTTGPTIQVTGSYTRTLAIAMSTNGVDAAGMSTAISANRISGVFAKNGGTIGFWVATAIAPDQVGTRYSFAGKINSGPDAGTTYDGSLQLFGDRYGGLVGFLTLQDGSVLQVSGQSVNGNVNMLIVVREGTPLFASGTTMLGGNLRGTIAGPLAGDDGGWTATR
jgi:hypothetical protein